MLREKRTFWRKLLSLPSWERGLKFNGLGISIKGAYVAPLVGAWIEIYHACQQPAVELVAPLVGAWIEIYFALFIKNGVFGRSPRGSVD